MKLLILDRDGLLNLSSDNPMSPLYYILKPENLQILEGVKEVISGLGNIPIVLATRQTCINKGLVSRHQVDLINEHLQFLLNFRFTQIYVEESASDKGAIFQDILNDYRNYQVFLLDNSSRECSVAMNLGIYTLCTTKLTDIYKWEKFWS